MSVVEPGSAGRGLVTRLTSLLLRPERTWAEIEVEPASIGDLFRRWVAPLAAVPVVCRTIGVLVFGDAIMGIGLRPPVAIALGEALVSYGLTLVGVFLTARIIDVIAPTFGGARSPLQAFKLAAYSGSAVWAAGVLFLYPPVGELAGLLAGLYSLYLLYAGLPRLMAAAPEHRVSYFAVILLAVLVLAVLTATVGARIRDLGGPLHVASATAYASPT